MFIPLSQTFQDAANRIIHGQSFAGVKLWGKSSLGIYYSVLSQSTHVCDCGVSDGVFGLHKTNDGRKPANDLLKNVLVSIAFPKV
jgi:hypothetical protein